MIMRSYLYKDHDYMYNAYALQRKSAQQIGDEIGIPQRTISRWLHKLDISVRTDNIGRNIVVISPYLKSLLEGELFGDGTMTECGKYSAYYQHGNKHRAYIEWLASKLTGEGVTQGGEIREQIIQNKRGEKRTFYHYRSLSYVVFRPFRDRFYPDGGKIVPKDVVLNPIILRQWYMGDGCLSRPPYGRCIVLYTCAFPYKDVEFLMEQLARLGLKITYDKYYNSIRISAYSVDDFLDIIGPCPVACYAYKWNRRPGKRFKKK